MSRGPSAGRRDPGGAAPSLRPPPRPEDGLPAASRRRAGGAAVVALLLGTAACKNASQDVAGPAAPPDPTATFSRVQREVFTPSCALAGCHAAATSQVGLVLEAGRAYASLVGAVSVETSLLRVMAGLPNDSYLVVKMRGDAAIVGSRMPPTGPGVSSAQLQLVVDWIRRGAPND